MKTDELKHYFQYRWIRSVAWVVRLLGFCFLYASEARTDSRFFQGGFKMGYAAQDMSWFAAHYGSIAVGLIILSYLLEFIENSLDAKKTLPLE